MLETYVSHTKPCSRMRSLSESRGGSKVTKPIFSNSRKRYYCVGLTGKTSSSTVVEYKDVLLPNNATNWM